MKKIFIKIVNVIKKRELSAYLYILPSLVFVLIFFYYPALKGVVGSFFKVEQNKITSFNGISNYISLLKDKRFYHSLFITLIYTLSFVTLNTLLVVFSSSLTRRKNKLSFLPEYIFFIPMGVSLTTMCLIFKELFKGKNSVVNNIFSTNFSFLSSKEGAMVILVILGVFLDFGIDYILLLSSFRSIPRDRIEAARLDGAGGWRMFFYIELPSVKETLLAIIFLSLKDGIMILEPIALLTEGGPGMGSESLMYYFYLEFFKNGNVEKGNALMTLLLLFSSLFSILFFIRRKHEST